MQNLQLYGKFFSVTFWLVIIVEIFSFLGFNFPFVNTVLFFLIILATLAVSIWKLEYGFWIALTELIIGSKGYLFSFDVGEFSVSIRLGIFLAVFFGWLIYLVRTKKFEFKSSNLFWPFIVLVIFIAAGVAIGYLNDNQLKKIFLDANGYLYFGLLPVAFAVIKGWEKINRALQIMFASVTAISLKTIFLLYYFSHQTDEGLVRLVYKWVRDTGVGEITRFTETYFRIFFQSHIWLLFAFFIALILLVLIAKKEQGKENNRILWLVAIASSVSLVISFSRSFWLALGLTITILFLYFLINEKIGWIKIAKIIGVVIAITVLELGFITALVNIRLPGGKGGPSAASLIRERITTTEEAALGSRFQLLNPLVKKSLASPVWGSGFGTEVTYQTLDPRTKELSGGYYTSYAFEWGYLDILVKIGILGSVAYFFFLWKIAKNGLDIVKKNTSREISVFTIGLLFAFLSLLITHFTTPYLNHPLGIMLLILTGSIFFVIKNSGIAHKQDL